MKLAYFSPLGPQRSGISDYSEELLPYLAGGAEITLFVDGFHPLNRELTSHFEVRDYRRQRSSLRDLENFDAVIYHIGNDHRYHAGILDASQKRSGIVVFHDFALQEFFLGLARDRNDLRVYLNEVEFCDGRDARVAAEESLTRGAQPAMLARPVDFPLNCRIAKAAEGIIVHSEWSRARLAKIAPHVPNARIAMPVKFSTDRGSATNLSLSNTPDAEVKIASFGLITPGKGIEQSLRALATLKDTHRFRYSLVGETNAYFDVKALVRRYGMEDHVEITGHVALAEFKRRIDETDIALNIRERTVGETSASLCRLMAAGVCSIVAEAGWYAELPNASVVKIPLDSQADKLLLAYLQRLIEDEPLRTQIGANARQHAIEEHNLASRAADYLAFIRRVIDQRPRRNFIANVSEQVSLLGVKASDQSFLHTVAENLASIAPADVLGIERNGEKAEVPASNGKEATSSSFAAGRMAKPEGINYKQAAVEYPDRLDPERSHYLRTKPFYNLANKPDKHQGEGMDAETHRHFCDFANIAVTLGLPAGSRLLDVGCGSGWMSEYFARLGYQVKGVDISPVLIEMSRDRLARIPYDVDHETTLRCSFEVHDIESAPLAETFDAVLCYDSLHHFENEAAVMRNLAAMLPVGGVLFILEGERPPAGSATEAELYEVMCEYGTLESPFDYGHLRQILDEQGFAVIGDYVSVNGLFEREIIKDDRLPLKDLPLNYHYLACKKVSDGAPASTVPDSRRPGLLRARIAAISAEFGQIKPGQLLQIELEIENTGDTLWLAGRETRTGVVMPGVRIRDAAGILVSEFHGEPPLPHAVAPGEKVHLRIEPAAPQSAGKYTVKIDLVNQHVCWFGDVGSEPLEIEFEVSER